MKRFVSSVFKGLGYVIIFLLVQGTFIVDTDRYKMLFSIISGIIFIVLIWFSFRIRDRNILEEINLRKVPMRKMGPVIMCGLSFGFTLNIFLSLLPLPSSWYSSESDVMHILMLDTHPIVVVLSTVVIAGIVEEICFRGLIYTRFKKGMPVVVAALLSSLAFGILHGTLVAIIATTTGGLLLVFIFEKYNSILPCMVFHMLNNFVILALTFYANNMGANGLLGLNIAMVIMLTAGGIGLLRVKVINYT